MNDLEMKYFVLSPFSKDPVHARASRSAIVAYAESVRYIHPQYAKSLFDWVNTMPSVPNE